MTDIYANENFPLPVVEELRELGHDVLTTADAGQAGRAIPDDEVLAFAIEKERVLVTFNRRHFIRLHNESDAHTGIIVCTIDPDSKALAERIHAALEANEAMSGQLVRVNRPAE